MGKAERSVAELVDMISRGDLRLPEMQRQYVWHAPRVRDLLDSLYRGYPSGAILVWETDSEVATRDFSIEQQKPSQYQWLLLDGQQRLTSLSAVIRGEPLYVRGRKRPIDILFNLNHPDDLDIFMEVDESTDSDSQSDETDATVDELSQRFERMAFVVGNNKIKSLPHWVSVTEVLKADSDADILPQAGVTSFSDPNYKKYAERLANLRKIRSYAYRLDILERSMGYEEVTEIFVRVNSLGAKLRSSDLALAQITAKWPHSLALFTEFQTAKAREHFDFDLGSFLRLLIVCATHQSKFQRTAQIPLDDLKSAWATAKQSFDAAINYLRSNVGIVSPVLLSSPYIVISVAYFLNCKNYDLSENEARDLRKWILLANAKGRYSRGSSESLLDQDLRIMRSGGNIDALLDRLRNQVGRLEFAPEDLEGRNERSGIFKTMFLAFQESEASDWESSTKIAVNHGGNRDKIEVHHIFPKAVLRNLRNEEINDIANFAFISSSTNKKISSRAPSAYVLEYIERRSTSIFEAQCIPTNPELLDVSAYKEFLIERREIVCERLNQFVGRSE